MKLRAFASVGVLVFACSDPPPPPPPPPPPVCCPPSAAPACCMALGGVQPAWGCPDLTCKIPDPATPGWQLVNDDGCPRWEIPPGPFACGVPPVSPIDAGVPCAPVSVASYKPAPMTPPNAAASVCTAQELGDFYDACITSDMSSAACELDAPDASACTPCLVSKTTDASWGPVVIDAHHVKLNVAGCVALLQSDASATSCAQKISDEQGCEGAACDAVCPVAPDGGAASYAACAQQVAGGDCRPYLDAECNWADAGATACEGKPTKSSFIALASVFCGGS